MADVNVRIKRKLSGAGWDTLFPETTVDQIKLNTSGDALSAFTDNILKVENADVPSSSNSFVKVSTSGGVSFRTPTQFIGDIGAAPAVHNHTQAQVTNLTTTLNGKADLVSGKVASSQIPDYLFSGLKFARIAGDNGHTALSDLKDDIDAAFGSSTDLQREGGYFVANVDFTLTAGTGSHTVIGGGDEGDASLPIDLEKGDWIVYIGYNTSTSSNEWSIVNNTYRLAEENGVTGIVSLSPGTIETRAGLSATSNGEKVMDEYAVRKVMKDIFYTSNEANLTGVETGDLAFVSSSF